jgi:xylan 1,4-beta-xylosidase
MKNIRTIVLSAIMAMLGYGSSAQSNGVATYMNPVLPGSHPDQTLLKVGDDFYTAGSSFHWAPNFPIYHSTDLVHWKVVSNVVDPAWSVLQGYDDPKGGTWQGSLAYFAGKYWAYFFIHGRGQYCSNAPHPSGPWTAPVQVTGSVGYDNAVFVDDDGTPYLMMKNGPDYNRIQQLNSNGQLTGTMMDLDWVNQDRRFSWAEGPKMTKRNGRYYYFVAGHVYGGQYVLSSAELTDNEASWTVHGDFFRGRASGPFTGPNHITNPVQIADGTWWCLAHSYGNSGWEGQGRQSMLFQVFWDNDGVPYANNPTGEPLVAPNLPSNAYNYAFPKSDMFSASNWDKNWFFFNTANAAKASVSARPGYLRLSPGTGTTHILQRDPARVYTAVTKVDINAAADGQQAGLRLMNGEDKVILNIYSGYSGGAKVLGITFGTVTHQAPNTVGNEVWLKLVRSQHNISGFFSADGLQWTQIGAAVNAADLDKAQDNDNAWVGTALGLYATNRQADFDLFAFNYGLDQFNPVNYFHYNNVSVTGGAVTSSAAGGWCMVPGVTTSVNGGSATKIDISAASANSNGTLEVWTGNIGAAGTKIAEIPIASTGGNSTYRNFSANVAVSGQHDLYFRFMGPAGAFRINNFRFPASSLPDVSITSPSSQLRFHAPANIGFEAEASSPNGDITAVEFFNGSELIGESATSPYRITWLAAEPGNYSITAKATDITGASSTSSPLVIEVMPPQSPYGGKPHLVPGKIEFEHFDIGGNGFAYFDTEPGSRADPRPDFRTDEDVDIEECKDEGEGYNIGWSAAGEWLEYTVNVAHSGNYDITLRAAVNGTERRVSLSASGQAIAEDITIPNTGGWQIWQDVTVPNIRLEAGVQVLRITIGGADYVNLNYMVLLPSKNHGIQLKAGWNLVGCPLPGINEPSAALSSIWENVLEIKDADVFYSKKKPAYLNSLNEIQWGRAYWVNVSEACELNW